MISGETLVTSAEVGEGPRELAMLASLAGRIEPQLLRSLRLNLAPHRSAADEADLWFGPLVESAAVTGLVLIPEVQTALQRRLARDPIGRLETAWQLIFRLRTGADYTQRDGLPFATWLLVQEELTYWAVRGGALSTADEQRITRLVAWVENSLQVPELAVDATAWINAANMRLPAAARTLPGVTRLLDVARPGRTERTLWVRLVEGGVELSLAPIDGGHEIRTEAQGTGLRVQLTCRKSMIEHDEVVLQEDVLTYFPASAVEIDLRLPDGQIYSLRGLEDRWKTRIAATVSISGPSGWAAGLLVAPTVVVTVSRAVTDINGSIGRVEVVQLPDVPADVRHFVVAEPLAADSLRRSSLGTGLKGLRGSGLTLLKLHTPLTGSVPLAEPVIRPKGLQADITALAWGPQPPAGLPHQPYVTVYNGRLSGSVSGGMWLRFEQDLLHAQSPSPVIGTPVWDLVQGVFGLIAPTPPGEPNKLMIPLPEAIIQLAPRRILVAGTGDASLPENVWRVAETLGSALAEASLGLTCGGWPGVDHLVARGFLSANAISYGLEDRFLQLVERGRSPDLRAPVPPTEISEEGGAAAKVTQSVAVVLLGGMGYTFAIAETALQLGCPLIPVPGTGGCAADTYRNLESNPALQRFPDRRALRAVSGNTVSAAAARAISRSIAELALDCSDEDAQKLYRRCAAALRSLIEADSGVVSAVTRTPVLSEFYQNLREAEPDTRPQPLHEEALSVLRATLPRSARWLVEDFIFLQRAEPTEGVLLVQAAIMAVLLSNNAARDRFAQVLAEAHMNTEAESHQNPDRQDALIKQADRYQLHPERDFRAFFDRVTELVQRDSALARIFSLAREFLQPVDMTTFNASYRKLWREMSGLKPPLAAEAKQGLLRSSAAAERTVGYVACILMPNPEVVTSLAQALRLERQEAADRRETRPLWQLLSLLDRHLDHPAWRPQIQATLLVDLREFKQFLDERDDVDPGRECTHLLAKIVQRLEPVRNDREA